VILVNGMAKSITIYGIKKLRHDEKGACLARQRSVSYVFHDYKASGIDKVRLETWVQEGRLGILLNKAGTTFRKLPDQTRSASPKRRRSRSWRVNLR